MSKSIWFRFWWFAVKQGLWRHPWLLVKTFAQNCKIVFALWMRGQ